MFGDLPTAPLASATTNLWCQATACAASCDRTRSGDRARSCNTASRIETMVLRPPRGIWLNSGKFSARASTITAALSADEETVKIVVAFVETLFP
jgi:hypothetical protein